MSQYPSPPISQKTGKKPESKYKPRKAKRCVVCHCAFMPTRPGQKVGSPECALILAQRTRKAQEAKDFKVRKEALKTRREWLKEAQIEFNKFIRLRDAGNPCISCGRYHQGQMHAGHYRTVKACPELRFNELNCNLQCAPCNNHLSGNIVEYRIRLLTKIGATALSNLEGHHEPLRLTIEEIKSIKKHYSNLVKMARAGTP